MPLVVLPSTAGNHSPLLPPPVCSNPGLPAIVLCPDPGCHVFDCHICTLIVVFGEGLQGRGDLTAGIEAVRWRSTGREDQCMLPPSVFSTVPPTSHLKEISSI
uniref:Uncharacterized protein n=1 Tax=Oryza glumipatula TaxID=40148 RepID=A0A0D9YAN9_9ORYZ